MTTSLFLLTVQHGMWWDKLKPYCPAPEHTIRYASSIDTLRTGTRIIDEHRSKEDRVSGLFLVVMIAAGGGAAISFQSLFSGVIGEKLGIIESVFIVHLGGLVLASALLLLIGGGSIASWRGVPWYALCAGLLGVAIVASISYAVPRLGLATTLTVTIASQLIIGAIIDHFGLLGATQHPLDLSRVIGILILFVGTWLVIR